MKNHPPLLDRVRGAFAPTPRGVIGVVDDLLALGREEGLELTWKADQCQVRLLGTESPESTSLPLQKSVFRAVLARLAALCNERTPNAVSPYRGEGELLLESSPPTVLRVAFVNTPGEQRLELTRKSEDGELAEDLSASREQAALLNHSNSTNRFHPTDPTQ